MFSASQKLRKFGGRKNVFHLYYYLLGCLAQLCLESLSRQWRQRATLNSFTGSALNQKPASLLLKPRKLHELTKPVARFLLEAQRGLRQSSGTWVLRQQRVAMVTKRSDSSCSCFCRFHAAVLTSQLQFNFISRSSSDSNRQASHLFIKFANFGCSPQLSFQTAETKNLNGR